MPEAKVAFIGGSGLYNMDGLPDRDEIEISTPFGPPSDRIVTGTLNGVGIAFLPRHGKGHRLSPTELPARANIYALKTLGVERIISISAVGSLKESVRPLDLLVPDQLIDRTRSRKDTFFGNGIVAHVGFAEPFCPALSEVLAQSAREQKASVHLGGTYVVMEGPQFSTRAESQLYRSWGASVVGMTALPEAKLAREAEICYATLALVTDYDVWRLSEEQVSVELVIANLVQNTETSRKIIVDVVTKLPRKRDCACESALKDAIITDRDHIPQEAKERLAPLVGRYL
ncbi:MAG: S-methyl-5'-thioadenosine phosphorylase [Chloroflexi bacterium]|nr:S-methyl-5'-thioadenosine phosphorylase [Chloroflexota bacterium]MCH8870006.1 S-methyl-5'-thioadenosine phosphorylase [Chloroflexota bacterium]MCI0841159.1 S-methyl-5'-thioadenosine phosphorylase [Chloroflexota bacterium]